MVGSKLFEGIIIAFAQLLGAWVRHKVKDEGDGGSAQEADLEMLARAFRLLAPSFLHGAWSTE